MSAWSVAPSCQFPVNSNKLELSRIAVSPKAQVGALTFLCSLSPQQELSACCDPKALGTGGVQVGLAPCPWGCGGNWGKST